MKVLRLERLGFLLPWSNQGAPTEFLVFPLGPDGEANVDTEKGKYVFDDKAAVDVLANYQRRGIELMGDWEHQSLDEKTVGPKPASIKSMGIELRPDGLYATNVRWSDDAKQLVDRGEYRYFSPAFKFDKETKRITMLVNIALTNLPATNQMRPLVAAADDKEGIERATATWRELERSEIDDAAAIREHLLRQQKPNEEIATMADEKKTGGEGFPQGFPLTKLGEAIQDGMKKKGIGHEDLAKHLGIGVDSLKKMATCKGEELSAEHHACMKKMADHLGMKAGKLRAMAFGEDEDDAPPAKKDDDKKDDGKEAAALMSEMKGEIAALRAENGETSKLRQELATMRQERLDREVENVVRKAVGEGKLVTPAEQEWARNLGKTDMAQLSGFLKVAQPKGPASFHEFHTPDKPNEIATLTAADVQVAKMLGSDPAQLAQFKATEFKGGSFPGFKPIEDKPAT